MKHIKTSVAENIDIKQTSPPAMTKGAHLSGKTGLTILPDMVGPLHPGRPANGRHSVTKAVYSVVFLNDIHEFVPCFSTTRLWF